MCLCVVLCCLQATGIFESDAAIDVEAAKHVFMEHVDSSDVGKLVRACLLYRSTQQG